MLFSPHSGKNDYNFFLSSELITQSKFCFPSKRSIFYLSTNNQFVLFGLLMTTSFSELFVYRLESRPSVVLDKQTNNQCLCYEIICTVLQLKESVCTQKMRELPSAFHQISTRRTNFSEQKLTRWGENNYFSPLEGTLQGIQYFFYQLLKHLFLLSLSGPLCWKQIRIFSWFFWI